jgi:YVTN family beta-propeller protein
MSPFNANLRYKSAALIGAFAVGLTFAAVGAAAHESNSHHVYVPNRASADVAVIDTATDEVVQRIPVGKVPHQVVLADEIGKLVASNTADNTISIVDLESLEPLATIRLGYQPEHMQISFSGQTLAVGNIGAGTVSLVSLTENREVARIDGLFEPHNLTFSADDSLLYVANLGADHVSVVDVARAEVIKEIPVSTQNRVAALGDGGSEQYQGIINVTQTRDGHGTMD